MVGAKDYLWLRGRQYYMKLGIPVRLRQYFPGKKGKPLDTILESLGSVSYDAARIECGRRVADYRELFARAAAMTPEGIRAEIEAIRQRAAARQVTGMLEPELARVRRTAFEKAPLNLNLAYGGEVQEVAERVGLKIKDDMTDASWKDIFAKLEEANRQGIIAYLTGRAPEATTPAAAGETISQARDALFAEMTRDPTAAPRKATLDGHRQRVQALIAYCGGDVSLTDVTRAKASDFLASLNLLNRTRNNYATTLAMVFKSAKQRGRFGGDNPFEDQHQKAVGKKREKFTVGELQTIFDALPREIKPAKHTPESAVPWAALIAAFSGMRREEVCQLTVADIKTLPANGGTVDCFLLHNGGENHLKNDPSERAVPIHSELVRHGLLDYVKALPKDGLLFPGLKRRASKDNKIGGRVGEIFNKKLRKLGLKERGMLDFHSLRHTVISILEGAGKRESDVAAVVGHYKEGITFGVYGVSEQDIMKNGHPVLKERAGTVEAIAYEGLKVPAAKKK
jgi:integrase